jgi:hemerythrin
MFHWSDKFLVGIARIDFEHRIFLDLIADFEKAIHAKSEPQELQNILEEIILYAKFHFRSEENMMAKIGYPDLAEHRDIHYHLIDNLNNKATAIIMGLIKPEDMLAFLIDWFTQHTTLEDIKIAAFASATQGAQAPLIRPVTADELPNGVS